MKIAAAPWLLEGAIENSPGWTLSGAKGEPWNSVTNCTRVPQGRTNK